MINKDYTSANPDPLNMFVVKGLEGLYHDESHLVNVRNFLDSTTFCDQTLGLNRYYSIY